MSEYVNHLLSILEKPARPNQSVAVRMLITAPFKTPHLLTQFRSLRIVPDSPSLTPTQRIANGIAGVWKHVSVADWNSAFSACIHSIGIVGNIVKANPSPDSADTSAPPPPPHTPYTCTLIVVLQSLAIVARTVLKSSTVPRSALSQQLLDALRLEYAHLRRDARNDPDKRNGMVLCLIEIIKISVADKSAVPAMVDSLLASTEGLLDVGELPKSISVTFQFYVAQHLLLVDKFAEAEKNLTSAWELCLSNHHGQAPVVRRNMVRILSALIPLKLARGVFPSKRLLGQFPELHATFYPLLKAIKSKNLEAFARAAQPLAAVLFTMSKLMQLLIVRQLVQLVFLASASKRRVEFSVIEQALHASSGQSEFVVEEIVANLVRFEMISGYISYEENALMLTGANPFPPPPFSPFLQ